MVEYRVRPVVRYIVTRYTKYPEMNATGSSEKLGEFDSEHYAETVANALRLEQKERDRLPLDANPAPSVPAPVFANGYSVGAGWLDAIAQATANRGHGF